MNFTDFNKKINNEIIGVNHHYVDPQVPRNDDDILSKNQELVSEGKQQFFIWYSEGNEDNGNIYILINLVKNRDGKKIYIIVVLILILHIHSRLTMTLIIFMKYPMNIYIRSY